jgi:hypothetical protein
VKPQRKSLGNMGTKYGNTHHNDYQWRFIAGKIHLNVNFPIWPPLMTPEGKNVGICMVVRAAIREPAFTQQAIRNPTVHRLISTNLAKRGGATTVYLRPKKMQDLARNQPVAMNQTVAIYNLVGKLLVTPWPSIL